MKREKPRFGHRVRALRRERGLTQVELARRLDISASYLNLIEHEQRALPAPLLLRLAQQFDLDLEDFAPEPDDQLCADLLEVFSDPILEEQPLVSDEVRELVDTSPTAARAMLTLYRAYRQSRVTADGLASQIYDDQQVLGVERSRVASEEVSDFLQRHRNYFADLEQAADQLRAEAELGFDDVTPRLAKFLEQAHGIRVELRGLDGEDQALRRYDPKRRRLQLSQTLGPSTRAFELAAATALIHHRHELERLVNDSTLTSKQARALGRVVLANYFAAAIVMPYEPFLAAAKSERYDIEMLCRRFDASFEQVCHRLTSLRRPGAEGVPFHMIRVDLAGNISKRFSASGIRFARFSGACPRWNVFSAFLTPGAIRVQVSEMPDGEHYFCIARTIMRGRGGYHNPHTVLALGLGCRLEHARELIYSDGVELAEQATPVGVTCRLCERKACEQRAFPSIREPLVVDEHVRGPSFHCPPGRRSGV